MKTGGLEAVWLLAHGRILHLNLGNPTHQDRSHTHFQAKSMIAKTRRTRRSEGVVSRFWTAVRFADGHC